MYKHLLPKPIKWGQQASNVIVSWVNVRKFLTICDIYNVCTTRKSLRDYYQKSRTISCNKVPFKYHLHIPKGLHEIYERIYGGLL